MALLAQACSPPEQSTPGQAPPRRNPAHSLDGASRGTQINRNCLGCAFRLANPAEAARRARAHPVHPSPGHARPHQPLPTKPQAPLVLRAPSSLHPGQSRSGFYDPLERPAPPARQPRPRSLPPAPTQAPRAAASARSQTLSPASRAPAPRAAPRSPPRPASRALGVAAVSCGGACSRFASRSRTPSSSSVVAARLQVGRLPLRCGSPCRRALLGARRGPGQLEGAAARGAHTVMAAGRRAPQVLHGLLEPCWVLFCLGGAFCFFGPIRCSRLSYF